MARPCVFVLEGKWWDAVEPPLVYPFLDALGRSLGGELDVVLNTFQGEDDLKGYLAGIPRNRSAFVYIACHGERLGLNPFPKRWIGPEPLREILSETREGAIGFLHFSSCGMIDPAARRASLAGYAERTNARWVSGFTRDVDWHRSVLFDLALIHELYVPAYHGEITNLAVHARKFVGFFGNLARSLGFSALYRTASNSKGVLIPPRSAR